METNKRKNLDSDIYCSKKFSKVNSKNKSKNSKPDVKNKLQYVSLNEYELDNLQYIIAIEYDKRTYFQYYWSLLKRKHLIIFTFFPNNDYNLRIIKFSLFLLSFSLFFSINGLFFTDNTMHKIYLDKGKYNLIYRIPQILYSTIITSIINTILKLLSLSERRILALKKINNYKIFKSKENSIKININISIIIFYIISIILMSFFWLFISCFCAVYVNTQIILIKDTLLSFLSSMIYPLLINFLPGVFRIPALRTKQKDKECIYKLSSWISII